jgi:hypothetical protein
VEGDGYVLLKRIIPTSAQQSEGDTSEVPVGKSTCNAYRTASRISESLPPHCPARCEGSDTISQMLEGNASVILYLWHLITFKYLK